MYALPEVPRPDPASEEVFPELVVAEDVSERLDPLSQPIYLWNTQHIVNIVKISNPFPTQLHR